MNGATSIHKRKLVKQLLQRHKENLLDYDIVVQDARNELHRALERFHQAVADRDAEARELEDLIRRLAA